MTKQELAKTLAERKIEISFKEGLKSKNSNPIIASFEATYLGKILGINEVIDKIAKEEGGVKAEEFLNLILDYALGEPVSNDSKEDDYSKYLKEE